MDHDRKRKPIIFDARIKNPRKMMTKKQQGNRPAQSLYQYWDEDNGSKENKKHVKL
jgi:hypothetical protein